MIIAEGGCIRDFLWAVETSLESAVILSRLSALGYQHIDYKVFSVFVTEEGHKIVVVHSTGRVQIRVDLMTPYPLRKQQAMDIARHLECETFEVLKTSKV